MAAWGVDGIVAGLVLLLLVPLSVAQPVPEPVDACDPEWCDPWEANGANVKRGDEPVRLIMFAHYEEPLAGAPLNSQPPHPDYEPDLEAGFLMPTLATGTPCEPCNLHYKSNLFEMVVSPDLVTYSEGGWRISQHPALAGDIRIAGDTVWGFVYLSVDATPGAPADDPETVGAMPAVGVHMRLATGRWADAGETIAEGDTASGYGGPSLGPNAGGVTLVSLPGEKRVYEFTVPMRVSRPVISQADDGGAFVVAIHPYQLRSSENSAEFMQSDWRFHTGATFPPRLVLDVVRPLETVGSGALRRPDGPNPALVFNWTVNAALGAYDIDAESATIEVVGPSPAEPYHHRLNGSSNWDFYLRPITFWWHVADDDLADGKYEVTYRVRNLQGAYELVHHQTVVIRGDTVLVDPVGEQASISGQTPAPSPIWGVVLVLAVLVIRYGGRRSRPRVEGSAEKG